MRLSPVAAKRRAGLGLHHHPKYKDQIKQINEHTQERS